MCSLDLIRRKSDSLPRPGDPVFPRIERALKLRLISILEFCFPSICGAGAADYAIAKFSPGCAAHSADDNFSFRF